MRFMNSKRSSVAIPFNIPVLAQEVVGFRGPSFEQPKFSTDSVDEDVHELRDEQNYA